MNENKINFKSLGLIEEITKALDDKSYITPTEIQLQAIPQIIKNKDVIAVAQTGTGKTASFTLPLLNKVYKKHVQRNNGIRALILVPTRELAIQVGTSVATYSKYLKIKVNTVLGGVNINPQMLELRGGADILIATPGRLLDLYDLRWLESNQREILAIIFYFSNNFGELGLGVAFHLTIFLNRRFGENKMKKSIFIICASLKAVMN